MRKSILFLIGGMAFAGQSIRLETATAGNSSIPAQPPGNPWRVEFSIHNWAIHWNGIQHALDGSAVGANIQFFDFGGGDLRLQIYSASTTGGRVCQIEGLGPGGPNGGSSIYSNSFLTVRYQEDPSAKVDYCQAWDINGNMVWNESAPYTGNPNRNSNGAEVGGLGSGASLATAYFRIYTSTVPTNARPPVTADTTSNCLVFWSFDLGNNNGSLKDSCNAGPYRASMSSGSPVYVPTPGQGLVVAILKTMNAPAWGNWMSLRAGSPAQFDGTASYSQADSSAMVSCLWQVLGGPALDALVWDNLNSCTPILQQGITFGDYSLELAVTDINGVQATATQDIGAVATDGNGVVVNANPDVDFLLGPMIAFGKNPWGYQDYWALHASTLRLADYQTQNAPNTWIQGPAKKPQWEYLGSGTVSFYFNCVGAVYFCNPGVYNGKVSGAAVTTGAFSFAVSTVAGLDLTTLPTHVVLYDGSANNEVRVCSYSGNVLNVCYDGWGNSASHTFNPGASVLQAKVSGTGTQFITDSATPVCPLGPGPPGPSFYSTGDISLTPGSAAVTGSGTAWNSSLVGSYIRVATMHSGAAFVFVARIAAVPSGTSMTLARPYPSDADPRSSLAYDITRAQRTIDLRYPHAVDPSAAGELLWPNSDCESETTLYLNPLGSYNTFGFSHDVVGLKGGLDGIAVNASSCDGCGVYGVTDSTGWVNQSSTGGISFYGESLAHRTLYYRSGLSSTLTAANYIADYWIRSPWGNADGNGSPPLFLGGEAIGAFVHAILDEVSSLWPDLRGYANMGVSMVNAFYNSGTINCNSVGDTRDSGYAFSWLILAAIYDPDTTSTAAPGGVPWRTYWQIQLVHMQAVDAACENQLSTGNGPHSWANGFLFNTTAYPQITVTQGSATATGTGVPSSLCQGTASGTATVVNGSNLLTIVSGTLPPGSDNTSIFLTGTTGGGVSVFVQNVEYAGPAGKTATLGEFWLGDSGTVSWISETGTNGSVSMLTIAQSNSDLTNLQKNWACIWNSSSSITLNRPWDASSGSYYPVNSAGYGLGLIGFGQQPFMLGIKTYGMNLLANQTVPALAAYTAPYKAFTEDAASWIWTVGMDQQLYTTNYGRIFQEVEPANTVPSGTSMQWKSPNATYGGNLNDLSPAREQNAETAAAHAIYYANNPTAANRALGDKYYGAVWGFCPWTTGRVFCDPWSTAANANASNLLDGYIHAGKWTGFFTGMGMTHRWPAVRLGGVNPVNLRRVVLPVRFGDMPSATSANIIVTAPSGAKTIFPCSSQTCAIAVDDRQGSHLYQVQYLSSSGAVLSESAPATVAPR